jgi:hypothetical protein
MAESDKIQDIAIKTARDNEPDLKNMRVTYKAPNILDGWLVTVSGDKSDGSNQDVFVLVRNDNAEIYYDLEEFAKAASKVEPKGQTFSERVVRQVGMPGLLALIITLAIIYIVIFRTEKDVPAILANSLATIIGFYFGAKVMEQIHPNK